MFFHAEESAPVVITVITPVSLNVYRMFFTAKMQNKRQAEKEGVSFPPHGNKFPLNYPLIARIGRILQRINIGWPCIPNPID